MKAISGCCLALAAMFSALLAAGCGDESESEAATLTTSHRPWVHEAELSGDPSLHVTPEQVVILPLNPMPPGADPVKHAIRYNLREPADLNFCISGDEPHLTHLELASTSGGEPLLRAERGGDCGSVSLSPGTYELRAFHDGTSVPPQGATAFLHRPPHRAVRRAAAAASPWPPDFMAFRYGGQFVTALNPSSSWCNAPLRAAGGGVLDLHSVFRVTGPAPYTISDGTGAVLQYEFRPIITSPHETPPPGPQGQLAVMPAGKNCEWNLLETELELVDGGNGQLSICSTPGGCLVVDSTTSRWPYPSSLILGTTGSTFSYDYKGYDCTAAACDATTLELQPGEVALFGQENYKGPAFVFRTDVQDFSVYNAVTSQGLAIGDNMVRSVRVGPGTLAYLYQNASYGGVSVGIGTDVPSLAGTVLGDGTASSMHVRSFGNYVLTTRACNNCILTGADLSGLDLSGVNFAGARFSNANLTGTNFQSAILDDASFVGSTSESTDTNLSDADFSYARLRCTDFSGTDLTRTHFGSLAGKLLVVDTTAASILETDPVSGNRIGISGGSVGSGTPFSTPLSVAVAGDGTVFIAGSGGVYRVDPATGARSLVWSSGGTVDVAVDPDGKLILFGLGGIARVDPNSGTSTLVSGAGTGSGPELIGPIGIAINRQGELMVVDIGVRALVEIDPHSGARTIVSGGGIGTGPAFSRPIDVALDGGGTPFVIDNTGTSPSVFRVDPRSGNRTLISGGQVGAGPKLTALASIVVAPDGSLFVSDEKLGVVRVDSTTGNRTAISNNTRGTGPTYSSWRGLAMLPTVAVDFSCRLKVQGATVDAAPATATFPLETWRYSDLTGAKISNATAEPLSTVDHPLDLSGVILSGASGLSGAKLDGVILDCATPWAQEQNCSQLTGTDLAQASLQMMSAAGANLTGATLTEADLTAAQLQGASLTTANLNYVNLRNADLSGAALGGPAGSATEQASLYGAYMPNVNLSNADLRGVNLTRAHIYGDYAQVASLDHAQLDGAQFDEAICSGAKFTGASLSGASFTDAQLVNCTFAQADLTGARFDNSYLQGADFTGASTVRDVSLVNAGISTAAGSWTFQEQDGSVVLYEYAATALGGLATDTSVYCPSGDRGGCVGAKLTPNSQGPYPPVPECVPMPPDYDNCLPPDPSGQ